MPGGDGGRHFALLRPPSLDSAASVGAAAAAAAAAVAVVVVVDGGPLTKDGGV